MAASKGAVKVTGVREVQRALKELGAEAADLKAAHLAVSSSLVPGIAQKTPRRTGALAASWQAGATKTRARLTTPLRYGGVIEYGWPKRGIEPARMIRDTIDASHAEILALYSDELEKLGKAQGFGTT
jgi:hypothetical protein